MNISLKGKSALVTGSTLGIGFAIAKGLAASGAKTYVNGRTADRVAEAVKLIKQEIPDADVKGIVADLQDKKGADKLFAELKEVDILVNNLGIFEAKPFFEITDEDWQKFYDVNVMSAIRMSRFYTPKMVDKKWGRVLFIASESAIQIPTEMVHYGMTKTAMLAISRGLAQTVAGSGVTVNTVLPGPTKTEGVEVFVKSLSSTPEAPFAVQEQEFFKVARPGSLIKRFIKTEEVASMVTYLSSDLASATTGAGLRVDGGVAPFIL
ncbi:oxidoreductase [Bdellovibrio bacteriovorus]|uniref:Oxidoreductase n=1 Tax=Bdellovibrio bacteriovorus TaxID=959 RepID=A0A150WQ68_BDEBC|nr:SDR family oxidoreductase [Bdellovibrio bacteriovorus]KYG66474.1 oxidoreductase [Bdellovibrio bacteriovorus]